ncbi:hypothetical protein P280DRAFT_490155 [Massarina eburnea CBS 473.64]|uniref:Cytokinesis regulator n=1 Tax=Massarina eburnea CBS 473.64 TaxID=1395130 RepID=A0A6A6S081_9PLEO|nr:hypothetical protein P280DRAFT_490155 [Massarina eburnea CBS 473.64]
MAAPKGSFAQRMAQRTSIGSTIENWDDDDDFDNSADLFYTPMSTRQSVSSRSVRSESNTGDEDWQVLLSPNDKLSTMNAISSAKIAGIPIPASVPSSALLGGSIKRLGKMPSDRKLDVDDDWGNDLELPADAKEGLKLKLPMPRTPADDNDDFDDWGEGSLGIRFAGTRRETRGARSSSVSAMSPSMGSIMTLESEDDDLNGLVLPSEPLDFSARLDKLKKVEYPTSDPSAQSSHQTHQARAVTPTSAPAFAHEPDFPLSPSAVPLSPPPTARAPASPPRPKGADDDDDFLDGLDFGGDGLLDTKKATLNRNVVVKKSPSKPTVPPAARPTATITFTDKPSISRIPRPLPSTNRSRLTPLYESGAPQLNNNRPMPTTTTAQYLRAKRSAPALRNNHASRAHLPFIPAGGPNTSSHHVVSKTPSQTHMRRDSDPRRPLSPPTRPYSRMSTINPPETPSRTGTRPQLAPSAIARNAPLKGLQPKAQNQAWSGNELEGFDDLPTSATKEKQFEKQPRNVSSNKTLRSQASSSRLPMPDRMTTPLPQTPRSPPRVDGTPRFARDTAASRNAREQRLASMRTHNNGPIGPTTGVNWKTHVANRSPHTSPTAHRKRGSGQKPQLIQAIFQPYAKQEKGMLYNPITQRWEGNEEALSPFTSHHHHNNSTTTLALTTASTPTFAPPNHPFGHAHDRSHSLSHTALSNIQNKNVSSRAVKVAPIPSPPRPALISQRTMPRDVKVEGGMIFDPVKMTWLKARRMPDDPRSSSVDMDDEDPFAGLEDLKDNESVAGHGASGLGGNSTSNLDDPVFVGEEFDLGPSFIRRQREEEAIWRRKVEGWVGAMRDHGESKNGGWRWAIRDFAASAQAQGR